MRDNYDFSAGIRGKFAKRFKQGTNLVALDPDVIKAFPNSNAVNQALRELMTIAKRSSSKILQKK